MPTLPDRSRDHRSYDQDKRNQPERAPVNSELDRGTLKSSSSNRNTPMEKTQESGRLNEESRSNFVGQAHQLNERAKRDDRDKSSARDSAGSHAKSWTHS